MMPLLLLLVVGNAAAPSMMTILVVPADAWIRSKQMRPWQAAAVAIGQLTLLHY